MSTYVSVGFRKPGGQGSKVYISDNNSANEELALVPLHAALKCPNSYLDVLQVECLTPPPPCLYTPNYIVV